MKTRIVFLIFLIPLLIISCKKETFPDNEDLIGNWVEITDFLYKQQLIFDDEDTLFYARPGGGLIPLKVDTLLYRLDKKQERLFLTPTNAPGASESSYKIQLDNKANELTVWGLLISIPESPSETKFKKQ
jgi:hypothetical protein